MRQIDLKEAANCRQSRVNLSRLCQGWIGTLHAALRVGSSRLAKDAAAAAAAVRHYALLLCSELEKMITGLRARAGKGQKIARQVGLSL